jgi:hypothetical protein
VTPTFFAVEFEDVVINVDARMLTLGGTHGAKRAFARERSAVQQGFIPAPSAFDELVACSEARRRDSGTKLNKTSDLSLGTPSPIYVV